MPRDQVGGVGSARYASIPSDARGVWRIQTEHRTVVFIDFDERLFHRVPAVHADGTVSQSGWDGEWVGCGLGPYGETSDEPVSVGHRAMYGIGFSDYLLTSTVVEIRPATTTETPPPNTPQWEDNAWRSLASQPPASPRVSAWCSWDLPDLTGEGDDRDRALADLADNIDRWLDRVSRLRPFGRTAAGWLARRDGRGSVRGWVMQHARERRPRW